MIIHSTVQDFISARDVCLTIGNFDGVHRGHQALIQTAQEIATKGQMDFILMTFNPHPRMIIPGAFTHSPLSDRTDKLALLEKQGVEQLLELRFDKNMAALTARAFVQQYLLPLNLRHLVMGHDFSLGKNREGNMDLLRHLGNEFGFELTRIPPLTVNGSIVSSTLLRNCLTNGELERANSLLGRKYSLKGVVGRGFGRGRVLGFPTANLTEIKTVVPGHGVYVTQAVLGGTSFAAITNIGNNPTFNGSDTSVETFFLDADVYAYGEELKLEFIKKIRDERRFDDPEALMDQIRNDVRTARDILGVSQTSH